MIGRAAMGRPWFIRQAGQHLLGQPVDPEPSLSQRHAIMKRHLELMMDHYGAEAMRLARKHIAAYTSGMGDSALMRQIANNSADAASVFDTINRFFEDAIARNEDGDTKAGDTPVKVRAA